MSFFDNLFKIENESSVSGLNSELKAIYIYEKFKNLKKSITVVTNSLYEANNMYKSLLNYSKDVLLFPMDDFLTSEALAISPELKITRLETLKEILTGDKKIVITNLMGFLRFLPKHENFIKSIINLKQNQTIDFNEIVNKLDGIGYERQTLVEKTGDFAVRGFVLDIFPLDFPHPIRIELWGDEIDSIRIFDENTQKTKSNIDSIDIFPYNESLVSSSELQHQYEIKKFYEVENISSYFNSDVIYININDIKNEYTKIKEDMFEYNTSKSENNEYMFSFNDLYNSNSICIEDFDNKIFSVQNTKKYISGNIDRITSIEDLKKYIEKNIKNNKTIVICFNNIYEQRKIQDVLDLKNIVVTNENEIFDNKINLIVKSIANGFIFNNLVVISSNQILKRNEKVVYKSNFKMGSKIRDINKLNVGDYVVHSTHGIGRYIGLKTIEKNKIKKDYLAIEYKGGDKLYIPVEKIELITKYSTNDSIVPKINKLGTAEWAKTKLRVKARIENIASELLRLSAIRKSQKGFAFKKDDEMQINFENEFPFEETADQLRVTDEIKKDMESSCPMDRLLCGDVGYGKTEVAFRAVFKAIMSGKQVAYLCPTTLLSNQQYNNAVVRFQNYPVNIALLNRFQSAKKVKEILNDLNDGKIDFVIGTHRLLSDDVKFKDLGLLVIDEEQRFGVKHKEKIKQFKNNIDILTLSATPIPRTLQMSMTGLRSLSLLETPPVNRYPVQTYVLEENDTLIKDAIYKELSRNGQVFMLFNSVENIELEVSHISALIPDAKITFAHGRMDKNELEDVMIKFQNKEYDILICTTIIETGIDIPNVNTLIIIDADRFGLSQLYQIRGRVGRSDRIAYCYLMYKSGKVLSEIANKRLSVIKEFTELGSGFSIAMRDLSIRGAGDILGSEQAGFVDSVGIELYLSMLNEEIEKLKGKKVVEDVKNEQPLVSVETTISDNYVDNTDLKIEIHKKINEIDSYEKLEEIKQELSDRFGHLPDEIIIYMHEQLFENMVKNLCDIKIKQTNNFIEMTFPKEFTKELNISELFYDVSLISNMFRFSSHDDCLIITLDTVKLEKHFIYYLIDLIQVIKKDKIS